MQLLPYPSGCHGCGGLCCRGRYAGLPPRNPEEVSELGARAVLTTLERAEIYLRAAVVNSPPRSFSSGPCMYLDEGGLCTTYETRPIGCRDFFASDDCKAMRNSHGKAV